MAKKKKRSDYQAPDRSQQTTRADKAAAKADAVAASDAVDDASAQAKTSAKGQVAKAGAAKQGANKQGAAAKQAGAKKGAAKSGGRASGLSARAQWGLLIGAISLIVGGVLVFSFINAGGGSGVLTTTTWDIPARDGDTDNGDDDGRIKMTDFAGTPTVVNFFASWCTDCDRELPHFTRAGERYGDQMDLVFVNANEDAREWRDMMDRHDIIGNYPVARDIKGSNRNGLLRALGGNTGMPATAYYDESGRLIKFTQGFVEEAVLLNDLVSIGVDIS